ncbi:TonB-dependent outer membrane receptor [Tenacibaculum maritimum]|uniref:TonB-dependent receptor n=1 Tax=Tenacibaculum maritimum TaxID=107401 RepID=UPI0012E425B4|nr:carboxypeptidase-like regulatory domain-containing protein [Tenacibaculum maritimum]CAA0170136.1 TonB-dependent outer membrane receptor [Tenacibaculum maritimum]
MKKTLFFFILLPFVTFAQKKAFIKGTVINKFNFPIEGVSVSYLNKGTTTDKDGFYELNIPIGKTVIVTFMHISYKSFFKKVTVRGARSVRLSPTLIIKNEELKEIIIKNQKKEAQGITKIDTKKVTALVGANAGVENVLMTLPGVSNNNELSTQYNVRGGNFDENLVYVNGIEIYRPFLIRSGQQEGLSFINSHMIQNINFSAGGFQAKYGDKLSSVLDITYRNPKKFGSRINLSLLGGSFTIEDTFLSKKLSAIVGVRYRDNSLFVNSKQTEVNFRPRFTDVQAFLSYKYQDKLTFNLLSNFSLNNYNYKPLTRRTRFGTIANPLELIVFYQGQEKNRYHTFFGAFSTDYQVNENLKITGIISSFNTQEEEFFDISASYNLGEVDSSIGSENFGEVEFSQGIGSQINHARNSLDALISNVQLKANFKKNNNEWNIGVKYQKENIRDRIREWEIIDSVGFSIRPPHHAISNNQPYTPFTGPIEAFQNIRAENDIDINRVSGYAQFSRKSNLKEHQIWFNFGVRGQNWLVKPRNAPSKSHFIFSPRAQFAIKPDWEKDMLFRISGGWYSQAPFYKELRDHNGRVNPTVKAQKSIHIVAGNEYSFAMWNRPFKLVTEAYYKNLSNVNSYTVDNVRIRYAANNASKAYAYGLDIRLNGEFVPGNDSWISFGYLKTEENNNHRGYIARPTDQRLKFGVLFQDYVPNLPDLKAYLNIVYNTGLPGGSPAYADPYQFQNRLHDYKRADLGLSYILADANKQHNTGFLKSFKELSIGLELFNIFDIRNSITNTWVRDAYSKQQFGIPNYMTGRVANFKIAMKF